MIWKYWIETLMYFPLISFLSSPKMTLNSRWGSPKGLHPFIFTSIRKTLFFLAAATSSFTCLEFIAKGFSHNTFFPASRNNRPTFQCSVWSTPRYTTSVGKERAQPASVVAPLAPRTLMGLTNVRVAGQLCIAAVSCRNAVLLGEVLGALQALWCDGCNLYIEEDRNWRALVTELLGGCQQNVLVWVPGDVRAPGSSWPRWNHGWSFQPRRGPTWSPCSAG